MVSYHYGTFPKSIFRYRSLRGLNPRSPDDHQEIRAIKNSYLWFSHFHNLNDPMESLPIEKPFSHRDHSEEIRTYGDAIERATNRNGKTTCCFSLSHDNIALWSYYAEQHQGICLEYDLEILSAHKDIFLLDGPVRYSNKPPEILYFDQKPPEHFGAESLLSKERSWAHEQEWRFISYFCNEIYHLDSAIKAVYFGAKMKWETRNCLEQILKPRNIDMFQISARGYQLFANRLPYAVIPTTKICEEDSSFISKLEVPTIEEKKAIFDKAISYLRNDANFHRISSIKYLDDEQNIAIMEVCYKLRNDNPMELSWILDLKQDRMRPLRVTELAA